MVKTHRDYFHDFNLSVGEYGELVAAKAFRGQKRGHGQRGYDLIIEGEKRVEVKSKLSMTASGHAEVINCNDKKFATETGMTHLVVLIIWPQDGPPQKKTTPFNGWVSADRMALLRKGDVLCAWELTVQQAEEALHPNRKTHISVRALLERWSGDHEAMRARVQAAIDSPIWNPDGTPHQMS